MLLLPDAWTWDCWFVDDGQRFHAFYLKASKALHDPERRHMHASVGHAVSDDLVRWEEQPDVIVAEDDPEAFDHVSIWTGSVVRDPRRGWRLFYTGRSAVEPAGRQRVGSAVSSDLVTWFRDDEFVPVEADPRWYEKIGDSAWHDEAWRDPWVYRDPHGGGWHMLITARGKEGTLDDRGVLGHAVSDDLVHWAVQPPWSAPSGFAQQEVPQLVQVGEQWYVVFSCLRNEVAAARQPVRPDPGMWIAPVSSPIGPWDLGGAQPLTDLSLYAGKIVIDRAGKPQLLAFMSAPDGRFIGGISDPQEVVLPPGDARIPSLRAGVGE